VFFSPGGKSSRDVSQRSQRGDSISEVRQKARAGIPTPSPSQAQQRQAQPAFGTRDESQRGGAVGSSDINLLSLSNVTDIDDTDDE
jgi:hypothetical protein